MIFFVFKIKKKGNFEDVLDLAQVWVLYFHSKLSNTKKKKKKCNYCVTSWVLIQGFFSCFSFIVVFHKTLNSQL